MAAVQIAGLEMVLTIVLISPLESKDFFAMKLVENLHREELYPIDEAIS